MDWLDISIALLPKASRMKHLAVDIGARSFGKSGHPLVLALVLAMALATALTWLNLRGADGMAQGSSISGYAGVSIVVLTVVPVHACNRSVTSEGPLPPP